MTDVDTRPTFEEIASSGGHKDATMHVGGHGEPWPDIKVLAITHDEQTYVCIRWDGEETVRPVGSVREGLEASRRSYRPRSVNYQMPEDDPTER